MLLIYNTQYYMGNFQRSETLLDVNRYERLGIDYAEPPEEVIYLVDGRQAIIRDVLVKDAEQIGDLYARLTPNQRLTRFLRPTTPEIARLQGLSVSSITDPERNYDLVVTTDELVVGHAGFYLFGGRKGWGEMQFTVDPQFEGNGLCKKMVAKVVEAAHDFGLIGLCASVKPENEAMLQTFRKTPNLVSLGVTVDESMLDEEIGRPCTRVLVRL
jgi:L-amino acid N-acyltransferase YncA